jgi:uncharacterized membrane protein YeaQ/YmgE (transglycosylase-associated protein family)
MQITWTWANLVIQTVAGLFGALATASAAKDHNFGFLGHAIAGVTGGAISGYFAQTIAVTVVTGNGSLNEIAAVDNAIVQVLTGACAGGIAMLIIGLVKHGIDQHRSK